MKYLPEGHQSILIDAYKRSDEYKQHLGIDVFLRRLDGIELSKEACPFECRCHGVSGRIPK